MTDAIPIVSFEKFLTGDRADQQQVAQHVYDAFSTVGFIYLKDHGIPQSRVDEIFALVSLPRAPRSYAFSANPLFTSALSLLI